MTPLRMALCFGLVDSVGEGYSRRRQQTGGFPQTPLPIQLRPSTVHHPHIPQETCISPSNLQAAPVVLLHLLHTEQFTQRSMRLQI